MHGPPRRRPACAYLGRPGTRARRSGEPSATSGPPGRAAPWRTRSDESCPERPCRPRRRPRDSGGPNKTGPPTGPPSRAPRRRRRGRYRSIAAPSRSSWLICPAAPAVESQGAGLIAGHRDELLRGLAALLFDLEIHVQRHSTSLDKGQPVLPDDSLYARTILLFVRRALSIWNASPIGVSPQNKLDDPVPGGARRCHS